LFFLGLDAKLNMMDETAQPRSDLKKTAMELVAEGKGILAADESTGTIEKRFSAINVASTEETRRSWREILFTTYDIEKFISGVILFDETIRQTTRDGIPLPSVLTNKGIIVGIKLDKGKVELANFPQEKITEGLDGLAKRLEEYKNFGAKFTKWRAQIDIGEDIPSMTCINSNAENLARFAAISQNAGFVPIVEPEVMMKGGHDIERCQKVTAATLQSVFLALREHKVKFDEMLLKPNMILPGKEASEKTSSEETAKITLDTFIRIIPSEVPGIVFLSGGQTAEEATANLNAMNKLGGVPWELSFSYGRALQQPALKAWEGNGSNASLAQREFYKRAKLNSEARYGRYDPSMEGGESEQ
jgi:fructose-bisphosphate aldolase class I